MSAEFDYLYQWLICGTCGREFGVFKTEDPKNWPNCLADNCPSYDWTRDPFGVVDGPDGKTLLWTHDVT